MALITDAVLLTVSTALEVATAAIALVPLVVPAVIDATVMMGPLIVMTAARHTGGAVARSTVVTAIPAVVHSHMVPVMCAVVVAMAVIVAVAAITVPGMGAAIGHIEVGIPEVEIVTMRVAEIDAEVPVASLPV